MAMVALTAAIPTYMFKVHDLLLEIGKLNSANLARNKKMKELVQKGFKDDPSGLPNFNNPEVLALENEINQNNVDRTMLQADYEEAKLILDSVKKALGDTMRSVYSDSMGGRA